MTPADHQRYARLQAEEALIRGTLSPIGDGCQLFEGRAGADGLPVVEVGSTDHRACELAYEIHHGPVPPGCHVQHSCGTAACVDYRHLRLAGEPLALSVGNFEI